MLLWILVVVEGEGLIGERRPATTVLAVCFVRQVVTIGNVIVASDVLP